MVHDSRGGTEGLPHWFTKPGPASDEQRTLFPEEPSVVLATLDVSEDELARWHARHWVSFGPERTERLEPWDVHEIQFVRDVVRSGLSDADIARLFGELPRPMNFDPTAVAYSFTLGWVAAKTERTPEPSEVVDEHLDAWLEELAEAGDKARLLELRDRIGELLETVPTQGGEQSE